MYDKFGCVLRIATTTNNVSFFMHYYRAEHRGGLPTRTFASVRKTIDSLSDLRERLFGCNRRYLGHLSAPDDFSAGVRALDRVTGPRVIGDKTVKGIDFFAAGDATLLHARQDPKVDIAGILRGELPPDFGVIKLVKGTYRYSLTKAGLTEAERAATAVARRLTAAVIIPTMIG